MHICMCVVSIGMMLDSFVIFGIAANIQLKVVAIDSLDFDTEVS